MLTITDASFAQEMYEDEKGNNKMHRSQKALRGALLAGQKTKTTAGNIVEKPYRVDLPVITRNETPHTATDRNN